MDTILCCQIINLQSSTLTFNNDRYLFPVYSKSMYNSCCKYMNTYKSSKYKMIKIKYACLRETGCWLEFICELVSLSSAQVFPTNLVNYVWFSVVLNVIWRLGIKYGFWFTDNTWYEIISQSVGFSFQMFVFAPIYTRACSIYCKTLHIG